MSTVQLIEKIALRDGVWLTFWDLDQNRRLSVEIAGPHSEYIVGDIFDLTQSGDDFAPALLPVRNPSRRAQLNLLIDLPSDTSSQARLKQSLARSDIRAAMVPGAVGAAASIVGVLPLVGVVALPFAGIFGAFGIAGIAAAYGYAAVARERAIAALIRDGMDLQNSDSAPVDRIVTIVN